MNGAELIANTSRTKKKKKDKVVLTKKAVVEQKREKEKNEEASSSSAKTLKKVAKRTPLSPTHLSNSSDDGSVIKDHRTGVVSSETSSHYSDEEGIPVERAREILEEVQKRTHKVALQALRAACFKEGMNEVTVRKALSKVEKNLIVDVSRYLPAQKKRRAATTDGREWCSPTEVRRRGKH